jgi:hypothetical protein
VIVLVDSLSDRHIVRIFDKDEKNVMTTILAIPNYRLQPTGKTVFQYWEVPAGQPRALRAWFYPGDNFGQEFAYAKRTAVQIAAAVKVPVPAIEVETSAVDDLKTAPLVIVDESGQAAVLAQARPVKTPEPAVELAAAPEAAQLTSPAAVEPVTALPATASALPLVGLAGIASLVLFVALGFRTGRRRLCRA